MIADFLTAAWSLRWVLLFIAACLAVTWFALAWEARSRQINADIAHLIAERDQAEADRLQTEAAYRRLRAQAAQRRGQDTPRTSPDLRLRVDGGDAS